MIIIKFIIFIVLFYFAATDTHKHGEYWNSEL